MMSHPRLSSSTAPRSLFAAIAVLAVLAAACGPATTPPPSASAPPPSASTSAPASAGPVTTPEAAAALVLASDSRFAGIKPKDPDMIGGCCFYEVTPKGDDYTVMVEIGWGDCPAGCINRHRWFYTVTNDGTVTFDKEDGPAVPAGVPGTAIGDGTAAGGGEAGMAVVELSDDAGIR